MEEDSVIGMRVAEAFQVLRLIGQGSMGSVYEAEASDGSRVAIKFLHRHLTQDPLVTERFRREGAIAAKIDSPFVATFLTAGVNRSGRLWIAFELLRGETLEDRLMREPVQALDIVTRFIDQALAALEDAHAVGVVHRDIRPSNLFLEAPFGPRTAERLRILDFGISKIVDTEALAMDRARLTAVDSRLGSARYMAPEQHRDPTSVDERADLYSIGLVAFRALAGCMPFAGRTTAAMVALKRARAPMSLETRTGKTWPAELEAVLARALAIAPNDRFDTAAEMREAWRSGSW